jgi:hypothetical protein
MRDRSYERRTKMLAGALLVTAIAATAAVFVGAAMIIGHFVIKFW